MLQESHRLTRFYTFSSDDNIDLHHRFDLLSRASLRLGKQTVASPASRVVPYGQQYADYFRYFWTIGYWPSISAAKNFPFDGAFMNSLKVFSGTPE